MGNVVWVRWWNRGWSWESVKETVRMGKTDIRWEKKIRLKLQNPTKEIKGQWEKKKKQRQDAGLSRDVSRPQPQPGVPRGKEDSEASSWGKPKKSQAGLPSGQATALMMFKAHRGLWKALIPSQMHQQWQQSHFVTPWLRGQRDTISREKPLLNCYPVGLRIVNNHRSGNHSLAGHRPWEREGSARQLWIVISPDVDGTKSSYSGRVEQAGGVHNKRESCPRWLETDLISWELLRIWWLWTWGQPGGSNSGVNCFSVLWSLRTLKFQGNVWYPQLYPSGSRINTEGLERMELRSLPVLISALW